MHYLESAHDTLDGALEAVARASIGCELEVRPMPGGGFITAPDWDTLPADGIYYDYALGVVTIEGEQLPDDYRTAIFEPCESVDSAAQVRYYLPEAISALEAGKPVSFGYAALEPLTHDDCEFPDDCDCAAGWALIARSNFC